jgi:DNA-binding NtrC family response regulator
MSTLLYVDDEASIGSAVARWFGRLGHTVHLADSVAAGRQAIIEHEPDALFIDVWLGEESGFDLMSWIEDTRPELANRVTFVTGQLADAAHVAKVWHTLGRPVLQKPFDLADMEQYVTDAERRRGA